MKTGLRIWAKICVYPTIACRSEAKNGVVFGRNSSSCLRMTDGITKEEYAVIKAQVGSMEEKHFCPSCWTIL